MQPPKSPDLGQLCGLVGEQCGVAGVRALRRGGAGVRDIGLVARNHHGDYGDREVHSQHVVEHEAEDDHDVEHLSTAQSVCNTYCLIGGLNW